MNRKDYLLTLGCVRTNSRISTSVVQVYSYQRSFKIRSGCRCPGGRYDAINWVLLLGVDVLHVKWRAVLGWVLGLLTVQAAVHTTIPILSKKCVDGLYPGLSELTNKGNHDKIIYTLKKSFTENLCKATLIFTHHDGFSLKCFYFLSQVLVCLETNRILSLVPRNFNSDSQTQWRNVTIDD